MDKKLKDYLTQGEIYYDGYGTQIWIKQKDDGVIHLADVRGWGNIQYLFPMNDEGQKKAGEFQDKIGQFIVDAINEKVENIDNSSAKDRLITLLESQISDLVAMSKIELGDDVIKEVDRLKKQIQ